MTIETYIDQLKHELKINPQKCTKTQFSRFDSSRVSDELLAKTEILGQTQFLNCAQSLLEIFLIIDLLPV